LFERFRRDIEVKILKRDVISTEKILGMTVPTLGVIALFISFASLLILLADVFRDGWSGVDIHFLSHFASRFPEKAGVKSAIYGSLYLILCTAIISVPLGVLTALYLEEYAPQNRITAFIRVNIANLAAVPSIVYGLLGLALFVRWLSFDRSILSGALTMSLLILPVIIIAASEAIRAVPRSLREAAYGVGATKSQVVFQQVLPQALGGIITGAILALSRAVGETAPLIAVGALAYAAFVPENIFDEFTTLSMQIFNWSSRPQAEFHSLAASAIIVLLMISLSMNAIAILLRLRLSRKKGF